MGLYNLLSLIIVLSAAFSYINYRLFKLPQTIAIMVMSLMTSILLVIFGPFFPFLNKLANQLSSIDFNTLLMKIMLSFLLFAGGMHTNAQLLKKQALSIITFATLGTIISTLLIGAAAYYIFHIFNYSIPFIYCLLFGALISPTDPIAVLGILKESKIPKSLEVKISGESLFNDGVGVVIFLTITEIASASSDKFSGSDIALLFLREAGGGIFYGLLLGYVGFLALKSIDNYKVEVLITLGIVMGGYYLADILHVSGPLAMVVAGLMAGNHEPELAMSDITRDYVFKFWELTDEILNAILFLLIGIEMLVVKIDTSILLVGSLIIVVSLLARWASIALPVTILRPWEKFEKYVVPILTWGGLRGGISVALALSLPATSYRDEFVAVTYIVVIFSILVQGLTIGTLSRNLSSKA